MPSYVSQSIFVKVKTSVTTAPSEFSIGAVGLMTNENVRASSTTQFNDEGYLVLKNGAVDTVKEMFGEDSRTYKAVKIMKAQEHNFFDLTAGRLILMRTKGTNATNASFTTASFTAEKIEALQAVSDGYISVKVDDTEIKLSKLDFTKISTVADIKAVFDKQEKLKCDVAVVGDCLKFTTKTLGDEGNIELLKTENITKGTDLSTETLIDVANGTKEAGKDGTSEDMTIADAIDYFRNKVVFCCFSSVQDLDIDALVDINNKLTEFDDEMHKVFFYNAPTEKAVDEINDKIFTPKGGCLKCMHFVPMCANLDGEQACLARCAVMAYATGTDTSKVINGRKVSLQGKFLTDIDLSNAKLDTKTVNNIVDKGVSTYQYILEQQKAMFRVSNNNWAPEDIVNYANIYNVLQTSLVARFSTQKAINKTNEDLAQVKSFLEGILLVFKDNKVFGDWGDNDKLFDGPGQNEGMKEALQSNGFFVYIPDSGDIEGFIVPVYIYIKIAGVVVQFILNNQITR